MELTTQNNQSKILVRSFRERNEVATIEDFKHDKLLAKFKALESDTVLAESMTRHQDKTVAGFVETICLIGNAKQRNAIARKLTIKDGLSLQSVEATILNSNDIEGKAQIIDNSISANILSLCDSYGCDFKGDIDDVTDNLRNNYKYFSLLDWTLFFNYAKDGRYKSEFQNVSVRGINLEFLNDWIKQYDNQRDEAIAQVNNDFKHYISSLPADVTSSFLEKQRINAEKTAKLDAIRERWHKNKPSLKDGISVFSRIVSLNRKDVLEYLLTKYNHELGEKEKFLQAAFKSLRYNTFKLKGFDLVLDFIQAYEKDGRKVEDIQGQLAKISEMCDTAWLKYRDGAIEFAEVSKEPFFVSTKKEFILEYGIKFIIQQGGENPVKLM